jgi:hypothetical protein
MTFAVDIGDKDSLRAWLFELTDQVASACNVTGSEG